MFLKNKEIRETIKPINIKYIKKKVVRLLLQVDMGVFLILRYNAKKRV